MATQQGVIKAFMASLDTTTKKGEAALDEAIKACSPFKSFKELKAALIRDCKNAKSADDFLKTYCGIDYDTEDNGAITGSDAGGATSKTDENLIPESGSLKTCKKSSFKVNGLTVKLGDGKTYSKLSAAEKFIWNGLYTWWVKGALDLIAESYGNNFSFTNKSSATTKELYIQFVNEDNNWRAYSWGNYNRDSGKMTKLTLSINMNYYGGYSKKSIAEANSSFDILIAHELTHSVMDANINYKNVYESLPAFVKEGLAVLTTGVTDDSIIKTLAANPSEFENGLNLNETNVGVNESSHFPYEGGFIFFRYLARQAGDLTIENKTANNTVLTFYGNDTIKNYASNVYISSGAGNDSVSNWDWDNKYVTVSSGSGNDTIRNVGSYSTLDGGSGDDSVHNWSDQVKIYGDSGNDTVINDNYYSTGNNVTIDGGSGNDFIDNWGNNVSIIGGTGNDILHNHTGENVGGKNVTISGGAGNDSIDNYGSNVKIYAGAGNDTIWNGKSSDNLGGVKVTISGGDGNDYIVNWGKSIKVAGDAGKDSIWGYTGNDTISGGAGADKIWGNAGNDSLVGGDGNDAISGGAGNDRIYGNAGNDNLAGGDGNDAIAGGAGNDKIYGNAGNDNLHGATRELINSFTRTATAKILFTALITLTC